MSTFEPGLIVAGKYELVKLVARGGMGSVWRARHLLLDVEVAVKLMASTLMPCQEQRSRFAREAKSAAQIKSPHVVHIYDYGLDEDTPYIVMELLEGEDLGERLRREKRLPPAVAAKLLLQIGRGLRKAHEMGIVHRDLKPANIFLARTDEEEVVKILDFGIARAPVSGAAGETTSTGEILGSPPYMSPEQVRGLKGIDHRTDQWSLGVVLYRVLTGKLPFQSEQTADLIVKICTEPPPAPSSIAPELPRSLDAFFTRVLARDPDGRFVSVREMMGAFLEATMPPDQRPRLSSIPDHAPVAMPYVPVGRTTVPMQSIPRCQSLLTTLPMLPIAAVSGWPPPAAAAPVRLPEASLPLPFATASAGAASVEIGTLTGASVTTLRVGPRAQQEAARWVVGSLMTILAVATAATVFWFGGSHERVAGEPHSTGGPLMLLARPGGAPTADGTLIVPAQVAVVTAAANAPAAVTTTGAANAPPPVLTTSSSAPRKSPKSAFLPASSPIKVPFSGDPYALPSSGTGAVPTVSGRSGRPQSLPQKPQHLPKAAATARNAKSDQLDRVGF
jgi:serine/threonine protein kinase